MKRARCLGVMYAFCGLTACGDGTPGGPTSGALVTFAVQSETFRVWLPSPEQTAFGGGRFCPWTATVVRIQEAK